MNDAESVRAVQKKWVRAFERRRGSPDRTEGRIDLPYLDEPRGNYLDPRIIFGVSEFWSFISEVDDYPGKIEDNSEMSLNSGPPDNCLEARPNMEGRTVPPFGRESLRAVQKRGPIFFGRRGPARRRPKIF